MSDYQRDGVTVLRNVFGPVPADEIDGLFQLRLAISDALELRSPMASTILTDEGGMFWQDFNTWRKNIWIESLAKRLAPIVAEATGNQTLRLHHDHVIVKTGMSPETPWHQDRPYYVVQGDNNFTIWMSPDDVPAEEGLQFIRGSHLTGKMYVPVNFKDGTPMAGDMEVLDNIWPGDESSYDLERGDAVIFDNRIIHKANRSANPVPRSSLSIRYLGDGATLTTNCVNPTPPYPSMGMPVVDGAPVDERWFPKVYG